MELAANSEAGVNRLQSYGVKGICPIWEMLPYTSYNNLHTLPTFHMLLHGVMRKTWSLFLETHTHKILD